jgi:hypothetical protein
MEMSQVALSPPVSAAQRRRERCGDLALGPEAGRFSALGGQRRPTSLQPQREFARGVA